jgi:hypothetical protein
MIGHTLWFCKYHEIQARWCNAADLNAAPDHSLVAAHATCDTIIHRGLPPEIDAPAR